MIFHLGDGWRDAQRLHQRFPDTPLYQVPGHCDFRSTEPPEQLLSSHTHTPLVDKRGKTLFMNPGSIGDFRPSYGIVTIAEGRPDGRIVPFLRQS